MQLTFFSPRRTAGSFLVGSLALLLAAAAYMFISGAYVGFPSMIQDHAAEATQYATDFRLLIGMFVVSWITQLIGVSLLCRLLINAGEEQLAIVAFLIMLVAAATAGFAYTFHMTVVLLVAAQLAQGEMLPAIYSPLLEWTRAAFGLGYYLYPLGVIGMGWGGFRSRVLGPKTALVAIALGTLTILGGMVDVGAPAVPLLAPIAIGVSLLWDRRTEHAIQGQTTLQEGT
jgi:hypothetical protein